MIKQVVINRGMFNEHISKPHSRINLNIDIERLGKAYFDFKHHIGFKNDDKRNIDFNGICVNRILVMKSLYQVVMFVVSIGLSDTTNYEEQRLETINESLYTELCQSLKIHMLKKFII